MRRNPILIGMLFPALLAGCFKLARESPVLRQYVLGGTAPPAAAAAAPGLSVGVRRIDLAPYLAVPAVVVRRGANRIVVSEYHRWGEDPGQGINRAVAGYLSHAKGIGGVDVAPWPVRAPHDFLVQLHVSRFEGVAPEDTLAARGEVHLQATWEIIRPADGALVARGTTEYREADWTVGDYAGLVTRLDRGLITLARELATCLASGAAMGPGAAVPVRTCDSAAATDAGA